MTVLFPDEQQRLQAQAKTAFLNEEYHACLSALAQLVPESLAKEEQEMIVHCQMALGEYEAVLLYLKEHAALLTTQNMYTCYIQALCKTYRFLDAWFVSCALGQDDLQQTVLMMENGYLQFHPEQATQKARQLLDLKQGKRQVKAWLAFLEGLTSQQAKTLLPELLVYQAETQVALKSKAAELLVKLNESRVLDVTHPLTKQQHAIDFSTLTTLEGSKQLQVLDQESRRLANEPQTLAATVAEIRAHWAYLYPFLPEVKDVTQWIDVYALDYKVSHLAQPVYQEIALANIQETKEKIRLKFSLFS